jgi:hypothetical protein
MRCLVRFQVFTAANVRITAQLVIYLTPWNLVAVDWRFGGAYRLHHRPDDCTALYPSRLYIILMRCLASVHFVLTVISVQSGRVTHDQCSLKSYSVGTGYCHWMCFLRYCSFPPGPYPGPDRSNSHAPSLFNKAHLNIILESTPGSLRCSLIPFIWPSVHMHSSCPGRVILLDEGSVVGCCRYMQGKLDKIRSFDIPYP